MSKNTIAAKSKWATDPKGSWPGIKAEVLSVHAIGEFTYVTYYREQNDYAGRKQVEVKTLKERAFRTFFRPVDTSFFEEGGTYKHKWGGDTTYHVQELYTISKPIDKESRRAARAIAITRDDDRYMVSLNGHDFKSMVRVK